VNTLMELAAYAVLVTHGTCNDEVGHILFGAFMRLNKEALKAYIGLRG
jgi:hypothetical protein